MGTLTIRNLDDAVIERLKRRAKSNNRSLEGEVRAMLEAEVPLIDKAAVLASADRIAAMTPKDRPQSDSTQLIREDRDR